MPGLALDGLDQDLREWAEAAASVCPRGCGPSIVLRLATWAQEDGSRRVRCRVDELGRGLGERGSAGPSRVRVMGSMMRLSPSQTRGMREWGCPGARVTPTRSTRRRLAQGR